MENLLDMLRKEQLKVSSEIIDVIFKCVDSLQEMVENIGNGESEDLVDVSDLVRMVNAIAKGESVQQEGPEASGGAAAAPAAASGMPEGCELNDTDMLVIKEAKNSGLIPYWVHVEIADTCLLKSARSYMVMNVLDELGDVIKSIPPAQDLEQEKFDRCNELLRLDFSAEEFAKLAEERSLSAESIEAGRANEQIAIFDLANLEEIRL